MGGCPYKKSDFYVGQKVYIELTGNAKRRRIGRNSLIEEGIVESIGSKYVVVNGIKFKEHDCSYGGLIQHTDGCVDYVLYPNRQTLENKLEKEELVAEFSAKCSLWEKLKLEQLRKIHNIIHEGDEKCD